ncbi:MAG: Chaperone protein DnaK [Hyphomonas sp. TMED17]|nr:MAG: Chaperone protein DnaK [Hyphomonas sp. TMED17]
MSLGIETKGDIFDRLIDRNTTIPTRKSKTYSTAENNQPAVTIRVFQGEREIASANKLLGQFNLEGIPPAPMGVPQIEVTFDIDANGIVSVSAQDRATNKQMQITIQADGGLKDEDIEAMVKDAEANADADKQRRELVEARNNAEALVHNTEKQLEEHGDKVEEDVKTEIETAVADLKEVTESDDAAEIQAKHQALMTAAMKLGEAIYNSQQSEQAEGDAAATAAADGDDVVDADFEEVDEDRPNS